MRNLFKKKSEKNTTIHLRYRQHLDGSGIFSSKDHKSVDDFVEDLKMHVADSYTRIQAP